MPSGASLEVSEMSRTNPLGEPDLTQCFFSRSPRDAQAAAGGWGRADSPGEVRGKESVLALVPFLRQEAPGRVMENRRRACMSSSEGSVGGGKRRTESVGGVGGGKEEADVLEVIWMRFGE